MKRTRRNHGATFKAQVALAAVKGDKTLAELAEQFSVHPYPDHRLEAATAGAGCQMCLAGLRRPADTPDLKTLHAKIGQLALENDFLEGALTKAGLLSAKR